MPVAAVGTVHVLLYGKEMPAARLGLWQRRAMTATSSAGGARSRRRASANVVKFDPDPCSEGAAAKPSAAEPPRAAASDVLVVHRKFVPAATGGGGGVIVGKSSAEPSSSQPTPPSLPPTVRDAVASALNRGMRIATDDWLERYLSDVLHRAEEEEDGAKAAEGLSWVMGRTGMGMVTGDVTERMAEFVRPPRPRGSRGGRGDGGDGGRTTAAAKEDDSRSVDSDGGGRPSAEIIEIISDGDSDGDVVILPQRPQQRRGRDTNGSDHRTRGASSMEPPTADCGGGRLDEETIKRRANRVVRPFQAFRATWLRGLDGRKEAKAKAVHRRRRLCGALTDRNSLAYSTSDRKRKFPENGAAAILSDGEFQTASPERQIRSRAVAFHQRRRERGGSTRRKYAFEECYDRAQSRTSAESRRSFARQDEDHTGVAILEATRERNRSIAGRLRSLESADEALRELAIVSAPPGSAQNGCMTDGDGANSRHRGGNDAKTRRRAKAMFRSQQSHRKLAYEKVARAVESYPAPFTLECLAPLASNARNGRGGSGRNREIDRDNDALVRMVAAPCHDTGRESPVAIRPPKKIECGGSVRSRLVRAVLLANGSGLLRRDEKHLRDEALLRNRDAAAIDELRRIWGVGTRTAARLVSWGVNSVSELRNDPEASAALNPQQRIGLDRYEDLQARIPREEATDIWSYVSEKVAKMSRGRVKVTACGSYRRGKQSSGDVDLIMLPDKHAPDDVALRLFRTVLDALRADAFLTDDLTTPNIFGENDGANPGTDSLSYMGICKLPRPNALHRRIDMKAYPGSQGPFALLYFTGDAHFNRSMRAFAKSAGLTLSDAGLACCDRSFDGKKMAKIKVYDSASCDCEEEIFDLLGIGYVAPRDRSCLGPNVDASPSESRWDNRACDLELSDNED